MPEVLLSERVLIFAAAAPKKVTVTNTGDAGLAMGSVKVTGVDSNAFAKTGDTCSGKLLVPSSTCEVTVVRGTSTKSEVQSALLEFADNGTASPQKVSLVAQLPTCKLPVLVSVENSPAQGSLLDTTTGRALYDPGGGFNGAPASTGRVTTVAEPVLTGTASGYYDRQVGRWLPVLGAGWVAPDGLRYVYMDYNPGSTRDLHVVDVRTGRERILPMAPGYWTVVAFTTQGILVNQAYEGIGPGLSLVDPDTGSIRQVLTKGAVQAVTGSTAWVGVRNPADTLPDWGIGGGNNELDSVDMASGATRTWLYVPGSQLYLSAVYNGLPVIAVNFPGGGKTVVVTSPNQTTTFDLPLSQDESPSLTGLVSDSMGLWIGSADGVYLWTLRTGGILVSSQPATPAGTCA